LKNLLNEHGNLKYLAWEEYDPKASTVHHLRLKQKLFTMMDAIELDYNFLYVRVK